MNGTTLALRRNHQSLSSLAFSLVLVAAPTMLLAVTAVLYESTIATVGVFAHFLLALLFLPYRQAWKPPVSGLLILNYVMALGWLWVATRHDGEGYGRVARGCCLLTAIGLFLYHDLDRTGLAARRKARSLCQHLVNRSQWPTLAADYIHLAEVQALHDTLRYEPGPALLLLRDTRPQIIIGALTALQGRPYWRQREAQLILNCIDASTDAQVKIAGLQCLSTAADGEIITALADYMKDRKPEVRVSAARALPLHDEHRWPLIRDAVRTNLASSAKEFLFEDAAGHWCEAAVCDLTTWAAEPVPLGTNASKCVVAHYGTLLNTGDHPTLGGEIGQLITQSQTPASLRVDLAHLLRGLNYITPELLDRMTDIDQPGPLRILAAEMLLAWNPQNPDAVDVLRGLGRQSNRETALTIARLVQQYLGLDMGLPAGKVPLNTKQAAETAKRVFSWATGRPAPSAEMVPTLIAGSAWITCPITAPALPDHKPASKATFDEA